MYCFNKSAVEESWRWGIEPDVDDASVRKYCLIKPRRAHRSAPCLLIKPWSNIILPSHSPLCVALPHPHQLFAWTPPPASPSSSLIISLPSFSPSLPSFWLNKHADSTAYLCCGGLLPGRLPSSSGAVISMQMNLFKHFSKAFSFSLGRKCDGFVTRFMLMTPE